MNGSGAESWWTAKYICVRIIRHDFVVSVQIIFFLPLDFPRCEGYDGGQIY